MFIKEAASIVLVLCISSVLGYNDYCGYPDICKFSPYSPHITCGATGQFSPSCPSDRRSVKVTETVRKQILDLHNKHRQKIAGGNEPGFKTAARMTTMVTENNQPT